MTEHLVIRLWTLLDPVAHMLWMEAHFGSAAAVETWTAEEKHRFLILIFVQIHLDFKIVLHKTLDQLQKAALCHLQIA
jgi:hypothetical protein